MLLRLNQRVVFASALFLLLVSAAALGWMFYGTYTSAEWVRHTYDVKLFLAQILFDMNKTGRDRQTYLETEDSQILDQIYNGRNVISAEIAQLKAMLQDNLDQEQIVGQFEQAVRGRFATLDESLALFRSGRSTHEAQDRYTQELVTWSRQTSALAQKMQDAESNLLDQRSLHTRSVFFWAIVIAAFSFLFSVYVLWEHHRSLTRELQQRVSAEQNALRLSAQLLSSQDQERRKIARDLHDGLGQLLVGAKMAADSLQKRPEDKRKLLELSEMLAEAVASTRSISHLLHPPLVEELGFVAAARSYLEGFSKRSGIQVNSDLTETDERLPRDLELVLFRILQEALTNIQRHSKSQKAEVHFRADRQEASLEIRDFGVGLPSGMSKDHAPGAGVGLAGMKERVREQNGQFEIHSDSRGTLISATIPVRTEHSSVGQATSASIRSEVVTEVAPDRRLSSPDGGAG